MITKKTDRLLGALGFVLGLSILVALVVEAVRGSSRGLLEYALGGVLCALLVGALLTGYREALILQWARINRRTTGVIVLLGLDGPLREAFDQLRPDLGFRLHNLALVITRSEIQFWTGIRDPFAIETMPVDAVLRWGVDGKRLFVEVISAEGHAVLVPLSPRFLGRWVVRTPNPLRLRALQKEIAQFLPGPEEDPSNPPRWEPGKLF